MDSKIYEESTIRNLVSDIDKLDIPKGNKELAFKLKAKLEAQGRDLRTISRHMYYMRLFLRCLGKTPALKATREDIEATVSRIRETKKKDGRPLANETIRKTLVTIKLLYKLFLGEDEYYPAQVRWIKITADKTSKLRPADMLSEADFLKLIQATKSSMYRALWAIMGEVGLRPFEALNLKRKDIDDSATPYWITVEGKGNMTRSLPAVEAIPYVASYLEEVKLQPNDPMWITWYGYSLDKDKKPLEYDTMARQLQKAAKRAGLSDRHIFPYLFRHSAITNMAASGMNDQQIKLMAGHAPGSPLLSRYSHLGKEDLKRAVLKRNGMEEDKKAESPLKPRLCGNCKTLNEADSLYCKRCRTPLSLTVALETERHINNAENALDAVLKSDDPKKLKEMLSRMYLKLDYLEKTKK